MLTIMAGALFLSLVSVRPPNDSRCVTDRTPSVMSRALSRKTDLGYGTHAHIRKKELSVPVHAGVGLSARTGIRLTRSDVTGNQGRGMVNFLNIFKPSQVKIARGTIADNGPFGVSATTAVIANGAAVTGHTQYGVSADEVSLQGTASVLSNATDAECGNSISCADINSSAAPTLTSAATCGTSLVTDSGIPGTSWGVCASDRTRRPQSLEFSSP
jgi:hypothetical protein